MSKAKSDSITISVDSPERKDDMVSFIQEQLKAGLNQYVGHTDLMNSAIEKRMSEILGGMADKGYIKSHTLEVLKESEEMQVIREVLEEPLDKIFVNATFECVFPSNYISYSLILPPCRNEK